MIHEYRTYTMHPHRLEAYLQLAETKVQQIRQDKYGKLLGFWYSEFGPLHQVHHVWEHESLDRRQSDRKELYNRRDWMDEFIAGAFPTMQEQDVRFMHPAQDFVLPEQGSALYEARVYRTSVGNSSRVAAAVAKRPLAPTATRVGLWIGETPTPNEVTEIIAYRSFADRVADEVRAPVQRDWIQVNGPHILATHSTLLLPIGISPAQ